MKGRVAVLRRIDRITLGNFGDHKPVGGGVWELRVDVGPGYRLYYAQAGNTLVLLLCGGDKNTQQADIERALAHWTDWQRRDP
jgi:putative addiction module killer protein